MIYKDDTQIILSTVHEGGGGEEGEEGLGTVDLLVEGKVKINVLW